MRPVRIGDTVRVHYSGMLEDGTLLGSSRETGPIVFTVGQDTIIPGLERAVIGMRPRMVKLTRIPCDLAFGPHEADLVAEVDAGDLHLADIARYLGHDTERSLAVTWIGENRVRIDANHPLAGENLIFEIEVLEIIERGHARAMHYRSCMPSEQWT